MSESSKRAKKRDIINKLYKNFTLYKQFLLVKLDNVTSSQIQQFRRILIQDNLGEMVFGKNTVIKKAIDIGFNPPKEDDPDFELKKAIYTNLPQLQLLIPCCKGKI